MIKFKEFLKELPIIETVFGRRRSSIKSLHEEKDPVDKLRMLHMKLIKHYNKFDRNDLKNISHYTDWGANSMNKHLLSSCKHEDDSDSDIVTGVTHAHIKDLDKTLRKHKTPEELHVYSGINTHHAANLLSLSKKSKSSTFQMHHPAYLSTSIDKKIAMTFASLNPTSLPTGFLKSQRLERHILHITVPKGHQGAYVDHLSSSPDEKEFILPRGHVLSINKNPDINKIPSPYGVGPYGPTHEYTWHATLEPKENKND